mmetsp:Transcript_527/g.1905  ORF Transcript_527/g.1905 Transcript_527/m.1905 type:complete len:217 (-) Transcript_527:433-1083(-)
MISPLNLVHLDRILGQLRLLNGDGHGPRSQRPRLLDGVRAVGARVLRVKRRPVGRGNLRANQIENLRIVPIRHAPVRGRGRICSGRLPLLHFGCSSGVSSPLLPLPLRRAYPRLGCGPLGRRSVARCLPRLSGLGRWRLRFDSRAVMAPSRVGRRQRAYIEPVRLDLGPLRVREAAWSDERRALRGGHAPISLPGAVLVDPQQRDLRSESASLLLV